MNKHVASLFIVLFGISLGSAAWAEEIKVEAKLIWGTNADESKNPKHTPLDSETAAMLQKVFKWKNYFLETRTVADIPHRQSKRLKMSKDCSVEISEMSGAPVEVKLIGKGSTVNKTTKSLNRGEWIVIGGDDTDSCAWFVVLRRL